MMIAAALATLRDSIWLVMGIETAIPSAFVSGEGPCVSWPRTRASGFLKEVSVKFLPSISAT